MQYVYLAAGAAALVGHILRLEVPYGSPATILATIASLFFGLAVGVVAGRTLSNVNAIAAIVRSAPKISGVVFWAIFALFAIWMMRGSPVSAPWSLGVWFGSPMGWARSKETRAAPSRYARLAVFGGAVLGVLAGDNVLRALSLDITDTIGDFRAASVDDAAALQMRLCRDGACLQRQDWACGFTNGDEEDFERCFDEVVDRAAPSVTLDDARKYCGHQTMRFLGERYSDPERCVAAGGQWGVKGSPPMVF